MKHLIIYFLFFFFMTPLLGFAENPESKKVESSEKAILKRDTVYIIEQISEDKAADHYQAILEKTNLQLSLWWNPYGVLIGFLGILFTFLTIIAAVLIYRQSKEYKELIKESISKHENVLDRLVSEKNKQLKSIETNLSNLILEYKEKIKSAEKENKTEIKELISKLESQKESIDYEMKTGYVTPQYNVGLTTNSHIYGITRTRFKCSNCGHQYLVEDNPLGTISQYTNIGMEKTVTCPKCKHEDLF